MIDFEQIPHTADIKIRVYGASLKELFVHALQGMFQVIGPHAKDCSRADGRLRCPQLPQSRHITVTAPDQEALLVDFLSHALYLSDINNEAYLDADIHEISSQRVSATLKGVVVTGFDVVELKAVTYHDLSITVANNVWKTDIVFDI